jgi:hypothetical protein
MRRFKPGGQARQVNADSAIRIASCDAPERTESLVEAGIRHVTFITPPNTTRALRSAAAVSASVRMIKAAAPLGQIDGLVRDGARNSRSPRLT